MCFCTSKCTCCRALSAVAESLAMCVCEFWTDTNAHTYRLDAIHNAACIDLLGRAAYA